MFGELYKTKSTVLLSGHRSDDFKHTTRSEPVFPIIQHFLQLVLVEIEISGLGFQVPYTPTLLLVDESSLEWKP